MNPKFIVIEGIDGTGTTTQIAAVCRELGKRGVRCLATREPSNGPVGSLIRLGLTGRLVFSKHQQDAKGEEIIYALLFAADRADHVRNEIEPSLAAGAWVVSDRYYLSSLAYQNIECDLDWLRALNSKFRRPDITFLLDMEPSLCLERISRDHRAHDPEKYEQLDKLKSIRANYLSIAEILRSEGETIIQIDAAQPALDVTAEIMKHL